MFAHLLQCKISTRSQAVARIADHTASSTFGDHVTSSVA